MVTGRLGAALRIIGSLWFAALLLMLILVAMACATVLEATEGAEQALARFYGAWWFAGLLALLGINSLAALILRFPYSRRHVGFAITHGGIILVLLGAWITDVKAVNGRLALDEGETADSFLLTGEELTVSALPDGPREAMELTGADFLPIEPVDHPDAPPVRVGELEVAVRRFLPDSEWVEAVTNDGSETRDAVEVELRRESQAAGQSAWVFAGKTAAVGVAEVTYVTGGDATDVTARLRVRIGPKQVEVTVHEALSGAVPLGETGYSVRVLRRFDHARVVRTIEAPTERREARIPALLLRLTAEGQDRFIWIQKYRGRTVQMAGNQYRLTYDTPRGDLGYAVRLDHFRIRTYPGTQRPRSYESDVTIIDSAGSRELKQTVSMNHPVEYGEFALFQSSYSLAGGRRMSVLSVARDPGMPVVYAGYFAMMGGMLIVIVTRALDRGRASAARRQVES